jgi:hypothetical protein
MLALSTRAEFKRRIISIYTYECFDNEI